MLQRILLFLGWCFLFGPIALGQTTAIRAGSIVDPDGGTTSSNQIILVEKGKITAIGANVPIPTGATVIDLSTATVLPGLFDAHTHLCMSVNPQRDNGNYYFTTLLDPDSFRAIQGVANGRAMLESGFTTVRDIGNEGNFACTSVRRAINQASCKVRQLLMPAASSHLTAGSFSCSRTNQSWLSRNTSSRTRATK